jgi:hypothetical protein
MGAARLQWQVLKLHVCARRCPAVATGSQTAYKRSAVTVMQDCMHECVLRQWQNIKMHARMAVQLQWQVLKLLN